MLDAAHADGIGELFATPHVTPGLEPFPFDLFEASSGGRRGHTAGGRGMKCGCIGGRN